MKKGYKIPQAIPTSYSARESQQLDPRTSQRTNYKEPKLNLLEKFNGDCTMG